MLYLNRDVVKGATGSKLFRILSKRQWILLFAGILLIIAAYFILPVSLPLITAFITALLLNPAVRMLQYRFKFKRKLSVIIVYIAFLVLISIIGSYVVTRVITQVAHLIENADTYTNQVVSVFQNWQNDYSAFISQFPAQYVEAINTALSDRADKVKDRFFSENTIDHVGDFAKNLPQYLVSFIVYLIALFLFMLEMPRLKSKSYEYMTTKTAEKVRFMNSRLSYVVFGFLKAQLLVSIIIFIFSLIGLLFIAPEVAIIMSLIIWAVDFIPIIGSIAVVGPWALYVFLTGDLIMGTKLSILAVVLLAIRRTVEPKVMGRHIGLSPLATLIAMYLGLKLIGFLGFFVGPLIVIAFNSAKEAGVIKMNWKI